MLLGIAVFEGFYGGSHYDWLDGFKNHSRHELHIFGLPDRFWKWRIHGGAVTLAQKFNDSKLEPDLIIVTDMLELNILLSLTRQLVQMHSHLPSLLKTSFKSDLGPVQLSGA